MVLLQPVKPSGTEVLASIAAAVTFIKKGRTSALQPVLARLTQTCIAPMKIQPQHDKGTDI
jgi:hypothetical protein